MLQGHYSYSKTKKEFKPIDNNSNIFSIKIGDRNPKAIFVNLIEDKNTWEVSSRRRPSDNATVYTFEYKGQGYTFDIPDRMKRGQLIEIKATA